ncbi:DUF6573 family protein [Sedimenticola selenatireducens]|uniref:DUF6573 family protein n=1 Tax=Sedimenticola selenatireducens TaxID=191960 RepID=UPI00048CCE31|nr:DUF6573 family protein [Sedimenticola selenatireducens]
MSNASTDYTEESFFGEVISTYTRAQAIEDGVLIDAGPIAKELGFKFPVAMTAAVWADCVAWTDSDSQKMPFQDQSGRLYDVLFMAAFAIQTSEESSDRLLYGMLRYELYRVPRDGFSTEAKPVTLKLIIGPGDHGEPVITVLLLTED